MRFVAVLLRRASLHKGAKRLRLLAAVGVSLAILSGFLPGSAISSGHNCSMPCCAAGDMAGCAGGTCHFDLSQLGKTSQPKRHHPSSREDDELCGANLFSLSATKTRLISSGRRVSKTFSRHAEKKTSQSFNHGADGKASRIPNVSSHTLTRPCASDCGAAVSGFTQLRRSKDSASLSHVGRSRPPILEAGAYLRGTLPFAPFVWLSPCVPRGPPLSFS
jgi:hypothetical protein